jgi:MFS family permease
MRVEGLPMATMSSLWGIVTAPAIIAVVLGGYLSDRMAAFGPRWRIYFMAFLLTVSIPVFCTLLMNQDLKIVGAMMFIYAFINAPVASVVVAANLDVVRPRARGMMVAVIGICSSVLGAGLGPVIIGQINDHLKLSYGAQSLRYTLIAIPVLLVLAAMAFLWASLTTDRDAAAARNVAAEDVVPG